MVNHWLSWNKLIATQNRKKQSKYISVDRLQERGRLLNKARRYQLIQEFRLSNWKKKKSISKKKYNPSV